MSKSICQACGGEKDKIFLKHYRSAAIYVDTEGNRWYGRRCPDCYQAYKLAYDAKRRAEKGHVALGTLRPCSECHLPYKLENGASPFCGECRGKKSQ